LGTLFVTDLDGTFLSSAGVVSEFTAQIVNRLIEEDGLRLTYATARSYLSASRVLCDCNFRLPVIVYNGAFVVDPLTGRTLTSHFLDVGVAHEIIEQCRRHVLPPLVHSIVDSSEGVSWVRDHESDGIRNYLADRPNDPRLRPVNVWAQLATGRPVHIAVIGEGERIAALAADVAAIAGNRVTINVQKDTYHVDETWLEIADVAANKATAAVSLRRSLGLDTLVCFGDNENDRGMMSAADHSLAVSNAADSVKAVSDEIIGSNDQDGVARWLDSNRLVR
jgi:Cof subfamily protein (haloacid dehalogenase superfamily)